MKKATTYVGNKRRYCRLNPNTTHRKYKEFAHMAHTSSDQSTQLGQLSHLDSHYSSRSQKTATPSSADYV
jgi:hypothetical protein